MGPVSTLTFVLALCSAPLVDGLAAFDPGRVAPSFEGVTWNVEQPSADTVHEAATSAARALVAKVEEQERALRAALVEANSGMPDAERLATIVAATRRGFPKGKAAEEAEAAADLQRKDMGREVAYRVAEAWVEALPTRPALFPEVADARGKRYAKELDGLTKMATFDGDLTRHAKNLILRFELASQQPRR
jgi:hypothetical protein